MIAFFLVICIGGGMNQCIQVPAIDGLNECERLAREMEWPYDANHSFFVTHGGGGGVSHTCTQYRMVKPPK